MAGSSHSWERIEELFHGACDLDGAARAAYLSAECSDDPELRSQVEALLENESETGRFRSAVGRTIPGMCGPQAGARIGPYEVVRQIGQGGMGAVYLAVRADDHFRKQVAIKLIHSAFPSPGMLARFRAERQIVADLEHPYIARILDGGATAEGSPYLVMEYVDGVPLDEYSKSQTLTLTNRLILFRHICDAVSYAHRKLIIHRDIKPGNILVTKDGLPKLVDFGIAKLLDPDGQLSAVRATEVLLTPQYASPEQIRNERLTTATDVYALGVVLYEWLTGRRPYEVRTLTPGELERAICVTDPVNPSVAAASAEQQNISRSLRGDLDKIVMKAMHKDPTRRYASVDRLDDDIRRYLEGLPISARPDTFRYRTLKFIRRHVYAVSAAALFVVMLVAFSSGMVVLARRLAHQRDVANDQTAKAEQISQFLLKLFKVSDPSEARGNSVTAREILDQGAAKISAGLSNQPHVETALLDTMGKVYEGLGLYPRAQSLFEQSLSVRAATRATPETDLADSYLNIAKELEIRDLDYPRGVELVRKALAIRKKHFGEHSVEVADCLEVLGNLARSEGHFEEAQSDLRRAYELKRALLSDASLSTAQAAYDLAETMIAKGDIPGAGRLYMQALSTRQKLLPAEDPLVLDSMEAVAFTSQTQGKLDEAENYLRHVLATRRKIYGEVHYGVSAALDNLASVLQDEGKLGEAEADYREAILIERKTLGEWNRSTAVTVNNLAALLRDKGDYPGAEKAYREAVAIYRKVIGSDHPDTAFCLNNLAGTLLLEHKLSEAESAADEALAIQRRSPGANYAAVASTFRTLGRIHEAEHNYSDAIVDYQQGLDTAKKGVSPDLALVSSIALRYGTLLDKIHKADQAEPLLREALAEKMKLHGAEDEQTADAEEELGVCLENLRQFPEAETQLEHAEKIFRKTRGEHDGKTLTASSRVHDIRAMAGGSTP